MSSETGFKKLDEMMARWRGAREREQEEHATWEQENAAFWADWQEAKFEEQERREDLARQRSRETRLRASGIPPRAVDAWLRGLEKWPATEAVETHWASEKTFLLLLGVTGTGKTVAAAEALARSGGVFRRTVELARLSVFDREDRERLEQCHRARCLVLDDLGTEMAHDGWRPVFDELIDVRYSERRQTIITSNLDMKTLRSRYGDRVMDRIRDDGLIAFCGDKSRRGGPNP